MNQVTKQNSLPIYQLIAILEDAKKGYLNASEKIKDEVLSLLLERFGYQRGRYSNELRQLVNRLGTSSPIDQLTLSLLHRTWMDMKTTFKFGQKDTIIQGCIKAEETALRNYTLAIEQIPENEEVRAILQQQVNGIKSVLNTIREYTGKTYH
ncbi:MAG: PA2169 family four-helix-bundle protein [Chitinophagaceae bacterium]|nr:PA2169 family four-helix-bundle protein [Chitinophagaceae bacterium]MBK7123408.1 PA2169 family four-helix-bundle protein [Chitinophagaceae bacterium]MBK7559470.1 PA2169 family four-helix-bundle protein [Chitinophagaceae bacterium]MBK9531076.1 PA2169 family four-helix-bundle protein [Chitinophagaceae bacterium]